MTETSRSVPSPEEETMAPRTSPGPVGPAHPDRLGAVERHVRGVVRRQPHLVGGDLAVLHRHHLGGRRAAGGDEVEGAGHVVGGGQRRAGHLAHRGHGRRPRDVAGVLAVADVGADGRDDGHVGADDHGVGALRRPRAGRARPWRRPRRRARCRRWWAPGRPRRGSRPWRPPARHPAPPAAGWRRRPSRAPGTTWTVEAPRGGDGGLGPPRGAAVEPGLGERRLQATAVGDDVDRRRRLVRRPRVDEQRGAPARGHALGVRLPDRGRPPRGR